MAAQEMFLAMILTNAKREDAEAVVLSVDAERAQIELFLPGGTRRELTPPPSEILAAIITTLDQGQRVYKSSVYAATVEAVTCQRGAHSLQARVSRWNIEHT